MAGSYYVETEIDNSTLGPGVRFATHEDAERALRVLLDCRDGDGEVCMSDESPTTTYREWCDEGWPSNGIIKTRITWTLYSTKRFVGEKW